MVNLESMIHERLICFVTAFFIWMPLMAQTVKIGSIDVYGNRRIPTDSVLAAAGISPGESVSQQKFLTKTIEKNITTATGARLVRTAIACCDKNGRYHLFIGVAESDSTILQTRAAPNLRIELPARYINAYKQYAERLAEGMLLGQTTEDWSQGHSLVSYPPLRKLQDRFMQWADADPATLKKVLRSSAYPVHRAAAAQILAYNPDKNKIIPDLMYAIIDESEEVRSHAIKAMAIIANYASLKPSLKINVPYVPFVRLVNSVSWSDRNKGLLVLTQLSKSRNEVLFNYLRKNAVPALKEMSLWKSESHAAPAFAILARMNGWTEEQIDKNAQATTITTEASKLAD